MEIILHRRNTVEQLLDTPLNYGVEVDVRIHQGELVCQHDPFKEGTKFSEWLSHFNHGTLIINVKEEGLENEILKLLKQFNLENYFFLDQSFPYLLKTAKSGNARVAIRVSEYESYKTAKNLAGKANWIWIDTFSKFPLSSSEIEELKVSGFRFCLVSPELHGEENTLKVEDIKQNLIDLGLVLDAVCTKVPESWQG